MNKTRIMVDALIERVKSDQRWRARDWKETVLRVQVSLCINLRSNNNRLSKSLLPGWVN